MTLKHKRIAIDWDDTVMYETYPGVSPYDTYPLPHSLRVIKRIEAEGGEVVIWTARDVALQIDIWRYLRDMGIEANVNVPFDSYAKAYKADSRKIGADVYIDNLDIHCIAAGGIDWLHIEKMLFED